MKYVMMIGDGMADKPIAELGGKTPVAFAKTPNMDALAARGVLGMVRTVPEGFDPGSDVANMSLMGFDPTLYYSGRAPIEAASLGVDLPPGSVAFRLNIVSIREGLMHDYSSGHIETADAHEIVTELQAVLNDERITLYPGVSYRHLLVVKNFPAGKLSCTPPHDISGREVATHAPVGAGAEIVADIVARAKMVLENSPINRRRTAEGKVPATDAWLWGNGGSKAFPSLKDRYNISGAVISAVDLVRGLGRLSGMEVIKVEGATGYLGTNYAGKVAACREALERHDFIYLHIEAPDETSHEGILAKKLQAIEEFDAEVVGPVLALCAEREDLRLIVLPDHPTLLSTKTHDASPIPFAVCGAGIMKASSRPYSEESAAAFAGDLRYTGVSLFEEFIRGSF